MQKKIRKGLAFLQTSYQNGLLLYPRVDNSFILKKSFDLFPHPELSKIGDKTKPLSYEKYKIDKKNSLLFLSIARVLTPSNIESVGAFIDEVFDKDLKVKPEMVSYVESVVDLKNEFFKENKIDNNDVSKMHQSVYESVQNQDIFLASINDFYFYSQNTPLLHSMQKRAYKKNDEKKQNIYMFEAKSLEKALLEWEEMRKEKVVSEENSPSFKIS